MKTFHKWLDFHESVRKLQYQGQCDRLRCAGHEQDWHDMIRLAKPVSIEELLNKVDMTPLLDPDETPEDWIQSASNPKAFRSVWAGRPCYYIAHSGGFEFIFA